MALFIKQQQNRSEAQEKAAAELRSRLYEQAHQDDTPPQPDPEMLKDKEKASPLGLVIGIFVMIAVVVGSIIVLFSL